MKKAYHRLFWLENKLFLKITSLNDKPTYGFEIQIVIKDKLILKK